MTTVRPVIKYDLNRDVHTVLEMASRLNPFVYENATYGFMPDDLPKLTIGGLLMRLHRLSLIEDNLLSDDQRERLDIAQQQVNKVKHEWLTAYTTKVTHELGLHINELNQFLTACGQDQYECGEMYPSVAEKRVMAQILADEARELNTLTRQMDKHLGEFDSQLRRYFQPSPFIWDQRLQRAYPQDLHGFLYLSI